MPLDPLFTSNGRKRHSREDEKAAWEEFKVKPVAERFAIVREMRSRIRAGEHLSDGEYNVLKLWELKGFALQHRKSAIRRIMMARHVPPTLVFSGFNTAHS